MYRMQVSYNRATTLYPLQHLSVHHVCFLNRLHYCTHRHCSYYLKLIHPHFLFGIEGKFEIACDFVCGRHMSENIESTSDRVFEPVAMLFLNHYSLLRCGMHKRTRLDSNGMESVQTRQINLLSDTCLPLSVLIMIPF